MSDVDYTSSVTIPVKKLTSSESAQLNRRNRATQLIEGRTISWTLDPKITVKEAVEVGLEANVLNLIYNVDTSQFTNAKYTFIIETYEGSSAIVNIYATVDTTNNLLNTKLVTNNDVWARINDTSMLTSLNTTDSQAITVGNSYPVRLFIDMHYNTIKSISAYPVVLSGTFTQHIESVYITLSRNYINKDIATTLTFKS